MNDRQKLPTDRHRPPTRTAHRERTALMNRPLPSTVDLLPKVTLTHIAGETIIDVHAEKYRSSSQGPVTYEVNTMQGVAVRSTSTISTRSIRSAGLSTPADGLHGWSLWMVFRHPLSQYSGSRAWAWHQWKGTIIERLWRTAGLSMIVPLALVVVISFLDSVAVRSTFHPLVWHARRDPQGHRAAPGTPDETHKVIAPLFRSQTDGTTSSP